MKTTLRAVAALLLSMPMFAAGTFTVTNVNNSGPGSLRQAILSANAARGGTIVFAIGTGAQTIIPATRLPEVISTVIDGRTQPGFDGKPLIEIDASLVDHHGLMLSQSVVYSLIVNRAPAYGIAAVNGRVYDSYIGTDRTGMMARPNDVGIYGDGTFAGNLVAGNKRADISATLPAIIENNLIGTDVTGNALLSGAVESMRIETWDFSTSARTGFSSFTNNVIGGGSIGVLLRAANTTITGNFIGISRTGAPLANGYGIYVSDIPGTRVLTNTIANSMYGGVMVGGRKSVRTVISDNRIHSNFFGINLLGESDQTHYTLNDDGDVDVGPNNLTNFPVITRAVQTASGMSVTGTLSSQPGTVYVIELFASSACNDTGYGEGAERISRFSVTTDGSGLASFTRGIGRTFPAGAAITGTATSTSEGTSEFSRCTALEGPGVLSASSTAVPESAGVAMIQVRRSLGAAGPATVQYTTVNGNATAGNDYTAMSGTLTFIDGETVKSIPVPILNDVLYEGTQSFTVVLSNPTGASLGNPATATVVVQDDEAEPTLSTPDVRKDEGNSGPNPYTFTITLSPASEAPVKLEYATQNYTAQAGSDYTAISGTLIFGTGETQKQLVVQVSGDRAFEDDEFFRLKFIGRNNVVVAQATGGLHNDDAVPVVTVDDVFVRETDGPATAVITFSTTQPIEGWIPFSTTDGGSATGGQDFVHQSGEVFFNNSTTATIEVAVLGDRITEENEPFTIALGWPGGGSQFVLDDESVVVTILDDDIGVGPDRLMIPAGETRRGLIQVGAPVAADAVFALSSSAPDAIEVPASVTLPAGQSRVTFDVRALVSGRRGEVTVTFPPSIAEGSAEIRVSTYTEAELTLSPSELTLYPGQLVTVNATMTPTGEEVSIPLISDSAVEVPERLVIGADGRGSFTVKGLANGPFVVTATLPAAYGSEQVRVVGRVSAPPSIPTLTSVSPNNGSTAGGTRVDVHGALFRTDCELTFGGIPATVLQFVDTSTFSAIAPPHAAGSVDVVLTCGTDVASLRHAFTYRGAGPHLSAIAPSTGAAAGGTYVRITGQDFAASCWPFFGDVASPEALVRDANTITAVAPPHAAGTVDVRLLCTGSDALLAGAFTFTAASDPSAQIIDIAPPFGAPGDVVTISGTGFRPDDVVSFENVAARVLDSTPDSHTVVVPNVAPGRASVTIGSATTVLATSGPVFIVGEASPPRISRVVPATAAAGAEIVLEGTSLRAPYTFAIEGVTMPLVSLLPMRAVVRVPAGLTPGTYPIAVMNAANQIATLGPAINVRGEGVVVSSVAASCGATDGGIDVTITGSGFAAGATVTFDDVPATSVVVLDATRIQARVPANYASAATITVKNTDGSTSTLTDAFRYASPFDPSGRTSRRTRAVRH